MCTDFNKDVFSETLILIVLFNYRMRGCSRSSEII